MPLTGYFLTPRNWTRWKQTKHKTLDHNVLMEMEVCAIKNPGAVPETGGGGHHILMNESAKIELFAYGLNYQIELIELKI